jgi:tRNA(Ile)-lysidine synthase TilS/MesJ
MVVICVDHQLRTESKSEILFIEHWLKQKQIEYVAIQLEWEQIPNQHIQENARNKRYEALAGNI